jgi:Protein of unknown function (DUF2892)
MMSNIGYKDRILRAIIGLILIGLTLTGAIGVWGWIGFVPLVTATFGFCPAYSLFGVNTCAKK